MSEIELDPDSTVRFLMPVVTSLASSVLVSPERSNQPLILSARGVKSCDMVVDAEMLDGGPMLMSSPESVNKPSSDRRRF